jgi:hypothetical protein
MLRAAALSLLVLLSIAAILPLADSSAKDNSRSSVSQRKKRLRRHSRAWWRRYRAHLRRRRAAAIRSAQTRVAPEQSRDQEAAISPNTSAITGGIYNDPSGLFSLTMPVGWSRRPVWAQGEARFRIYAPDGRRIGQAALSVVQVGASAGGALSARARARSLGGVALADLRRTVIDKMIAANGWVTNDLEREINGRRVLLVFAQTAASSDASTPQLAWTFYFTELEGRIYSLATSVPLEFSDRLALESEQVMASFRNNRSATATAADSQPLNR